jgi:PAS domain S-box-containing protein
MRSLLANPPEPERLAEAVRPWIAEILDGGGLEGVVLYERRLFDNRFVRRSADPPAFADGGCRELAPREVPVGVRWETRGRRALVACPGTRDVHALLEVVAAQVPRTAAVEEGLALVGQAVGLCIEWSRLKEADGLRQGALGALLEFLAYFTHRLGEGVLLFDEQGVILHMNRTAERLLGRLSVQAVGQTVPRILPTPVAQALLGMIPRLRERGRAAPRRVPVGAAGSRRVWRLEAARLETPGGTTYVALLRDAGEEERLRGLAELDRLKNDFLATLSHELRTPVTSIKGFVWLLQQELERLPEAARDSVRALERESGNLARMVENLLYLADPTPPRAEERGSVAVGGLVEEVCEALRPQAEAKGIRMVLDLPGEPLRVRGEARRLRLLVSNLVDNAVKFSPPGSTVRISWRAQGEGSGCLTVEDDGPGMPQVLGQAAWDPFQQGGDTLVDKPPGLGLGLAIVRRVTEEHGGRLEITTGPSGGTRVSVLLPLEDAAAP